MQDAKTYRQYAADCRRIAATMSPNDTIRLLDMAAAWETMAQHAEQSKKKKDGDGR